VARGVSDLDVTKYSVDEFRLCDFRDTAQRFAAQWAECDVDFDA